MSPQQVQDELASMNWQYGPGSFALPRSGSTIELNQDQEILIGEEAARYDYLTGGVEAPETEAIVWNAADDSMTYITYYDVWATSPRKTGTVSFPPTSCSRSRMSKSS